MTYTATDPLVRQPVLQEELDIGAWMIDKRIRLYPPGSQHEFPVEYVGRFRRFNVAKVRAWFAWENTGFTGPRPY